MARRTIIGAKIGARTETAPKVQAVLTEHGCNIRTRVGLHEVAGDFCAPGGVVLLDMYGDPADIDACYNKLAAIDGVSVQRMDFEF